MGQLSWSAQTGFMHHDHPCELTSRRTPRLTGKVMLLIDVRVECILDRPHKEISIDRAKTSVVCLDRVKSESGSNARSGDVLRGRIGQRSRHPGAYRNAAVRPTVSTVAPIRPSHIEGWARDRGKYHGTDDRLGPWSRPARFCHPSVRSWPSQGSQAGSFARTAEQKESDRCAPRVSPPHEIGLAVEGRDIVPQSKQQVDDTKCTVDISPLAIGGISLPF
jgi:hypothetical protein